MPFTDVSNVRRDVPSRVLSEKNSVTLPLISVIVPVYNVSEYLNKCIDSIVNQTYTNLEIILVDDGSTDDSGKKCDEYARQDGRIKVIHKENGGVSSARNDALEIENGEYISFIDADDWVTKDFIEQLYMTLTEYEADMSICGYEKIGGISINGKKADEHYQNEKFILPVNGLVDRETTWFHSINSNQFGCYLCNKLFKKSLLHGERLDFELLIGEDMVYLAKYMLNCRRFAYVGKDMYKYRMNANSALNRIGNRTDSTQLRIKNRQKLLSSLKSVELLAEITEQEDSLKKYVSYRQVRSSVWVIFRMIVNHCYEKDIAEKAQYNIRSNYKTYRNMKYGSVTQQIAVRGIMISPRMVYYAGYVFSRICPHKLYELSRE